MKLFSIKSLLLLNMVFWSLTFPVEAQKMKKVQPYSIIQTWELPDVLDEVSGIAWAKDGSLVMVEDEHATLYVYNLMDNKLDREINFGENGDFEGVALNDSIAFAVRSDGNIFQIDNYLGENPKTTNFQSSLSHKNNVETLAIDPTNQRLLLAPKDEDPTDKKTKGLYGFDLNTGEMYKEQLFSLNMFDPALENYKEKKAERTFRPSDLAINPQTGEYYIIEGVNPKLLILSPEGKIKTVFELDEDHFPQPEGITFSPDGRLFISNEGHGKPATVVELSLTNQF